MHYIIYNIKLLAIVKIFKNWHHNLKDFKYKALILTDYNKLY